MGLTEEQQQSVADWIEAGHSLSDVQKKIATEFEVSMTYMEVRFLVDDLGARIMDPPEPAAPAVPPEAAISEAEEPAGEPGGEPGGGLAIEVDSLTKPGTLVSGTVVFSDGVKATWALDNFGRMSVDAGQPDYSPSRADVESFQRDLSALLQKRGF